MTEQLEDGIKQVKNIIRMEDYDLTEAGARLLVTIEQLIENLEYVDIFVIARMKLPKFYTIMLYKAPGAAEVTQSCGVTVNHQDTFLLWEMKFLVWATHNFVGASAPGVPSPVTHDYY